MSRFNSPKLIKWHNRKLHESDHMITENINLVISNSLSVKTKRIRNKVQRIKLNNTKC